MPQTTNLEAVANAIEALATSDPAPSPLAVHSERLHSYVGNIDATVLDQARAMRDDLDAFIRVILDERQQVVDRIDQHVKKNEGALHYISVMREALTELKAEHRTNITPPIAGTPTRKNGGKSA